MPDLFFEIADAGAAMGLDGQATVAEQLANARLPLPGTTAAGRRIEKQVNSLGTHLPMLQCAGLLSQNR